MRKSLLIITFLAGSFMLLKGQTDPVSSQFMFNQSLYNPGSAGNSGMICATAMTRQQWVGFEGAPSTTLFHVNAAVRPFGIQSGVGISIVNDRTGFDIDNSLHLVYSYIMDIGQGKLGIGTNLGIFNKAIDPTWNIPGGESFTPPSGDPLIPEGKESILAFDMGVGVYYSTRDYYAGISVTHLNEPGLKYTKGTPFIPRQYYAMAGYNLRLPNPSFELLPSVLIYSDAKMLQATVNTIVRYNKKVWGGVSYRAGDALTGLFGIELYNGIRISYAYDFPLNDIRKSTSGSHEFLLNYCFDLSLGRSFNRYKSIRFL